MCFLNRFFGFEVKELRFFKLAPSLHKFCVKKCRISLDTVPLIWNALRRAVRGKWCRAWRIWTATRKVRFIYSSLWNLDGRQVECVAEQEPAIKLTTKVLNTVVMHHFKYGSSSTEDHESLSPLVDDCSGLNEHLARKMQFFLAILSL